MNLELNLGAITRPDGVKIKIGDFVVVALDSKTSVTGTFDDMNLSDGTIKLVQTNGDVSWILASKIKDIIITDPRGVEETSDVDRDSVGYKCGEFSVAAFTLCIIAAMIFTTVKFIFWLF